MTRMLYLTLRQLIAVLITLFAVTGAVAQGPATYDCPTTATFTCVREISAPSVARPCNGTVFRVGQPVVFEPDPELAAVVICPGPPATFDTTSGRVRRNISHSEVGSLVVDRDDIADVIIFNIPGTVTISREVFWWRGVINRISVITIVDDGPEPVPPPVSVPPSQFVPKIEVEPWFDSPDGGINVANLDNSYSNLTTYKIKNTGSADLVLKRIFLAASQEVADIYPVGFVADTVVRPGNELAIDRKMFVLNAARYVQLENNGMSLVTVVESNDRESRFKRMGGAPRVVPSGTTGPDPIQPILQPATECFDVNNDGAFDTDDVVLRLLQGPGQ